MKLESIELLEKYGVEYAKSYSYCRNPLPEKFDEPWCYTEAKYNYVTYTVDSIKREVCGIKACTAGDEDETEDDSDGEMGEGSEAQEKYSSALPKGPLSCIPMMALTLVLFINF